MSQTIIHARNDHPGILIICPHCKFGSRYDASYVEDAIKIQHDVICVACGEEFNIVIRVPARDAELQRATDQTHTTEAIIKDIMDYVNVSLVDENEEDFERFLRERVFGA